MQIEGDKHFEAKIPPKWLNGERTREWYLSCGHRAILVFYPCKFAPGCCSKFRIVDEPGELDPGLVRVAKISLQNRQGPRLVWVLTKQLVKQPIRLRGEWRNLPKPGSRSRASDQIAGLRQARLIRGWRQLECAGRA